MRSEIIDFSISSYFSTRVSYAETGEKLKGTLPYISPEQSGRMNRDVDQRTDLYSLGILFYEMFTGQLPFMYDNPMELIHAHLARIPEPPHLMNPAIPPVLSCIIMKLLAKSPGDRYQSAEGLLFDFKKAVELNFSIFPLASKDYSGLLRIPEKLYGREQEKSGLLSAYKNISGGSRSILMLEGYSGTGKTSLINEIHTPVTKTGDSFFALNSTNSAVEFPIQLLLRCLINFVILYYAGRLNHFYTGKTV